MPVRLSDVPEGIRLSDIPEEPKKGIRLSDIAEPQPPRFPIPQQRTDIGRLAAEFGVGATQAAGLGFPGLVAEKIRPGTREILATPSEIKAERVARGLGTATGFIAGVPRFLLQGGARLGAAGAARLLPKAGRFAQAAAKGGGALGLLEAAQAPEEGLKEKAVTVPLAIGAGAALGLGGEALMPVLRKGIGATRNLVSRILKRQPTPSQIPRNRALVPVKGKTFILEPTGTGKVIKISELGKPISPLAREVSKFKNPDEFVRSNIGKGKFKYGKDSVFHETSPESAEMFGGAIVDKTGLNVSSSSSLALGQKGKGAIVEFNKEALLGSRGSLQGLRKPSARFVGEEFRLIGGSASPTSVTSITLKSGVSLSKRTQKEFSRFYNSVKLGDGSIRLTPKWLDSQKQQLIDIWNQAQSPIAQQLSQEKTAEFIHKQIGPKFAGNIKLNKFPQKAQDTLKKVVQERPDVITTSKLSNKQLIETARQLKETKKFDSIDLMFKKPEGTLASEIFAKRELTAEAVLNMGDDLEPVLSRIRELSRLTKEPGRALQQFKLPVALQRDAVEFIERRIKQTADPAIRGKLSEIKEVIGGREFNPNMWDKVVEWATAIKLSSLKTPHRAIIGNTFNKIMKFPERVTTSIIDRMASVISGRNRERFAREALADVVGSVRSMKEAGRLTLRTLLDEHASLREATRAGEVMFGRGAIRGRFGKLVRLPFRFVAAPDTFIRTIDKGGNVAALATRQALQEGLSGTRLANRIQQIITNPPPQLLQRAEVEAARTVFQEPLEGFFRKVNNLRIANPGARLVVPFFKTPINLAKSFLRKTPLTTTLPSSRRAIAGLFREGGGEGARVIGEALAGSSLMVALITYAMDGNITGRGPKSKAERDALFREGWQPNSVKIGDRYISFNGLEPLSTFLQAAATIAETREEVGTERAKKIVFELSKNFASQPFLTGLSDLLEAFEDERKFDRFVSNFTAGNIVPTGIRSISQAVEPILRVPRGIPETILSRIPGLTERVPPRRNVFGEEIAIGGAPLERAISPTRISKINVTPVDAELRKLGVTIGFPSTTASNLKLTPEEYDEILRVSGPKIKQQIGALLTMNDYWILDSDNRTKLIKGIERDERKEIRDEIVTRKVIEGINEKGIDFLVDLKRKGKLTEQVELIGAVYLEQLGLMR